MPRATVNGISLYYETSGKGDPLLLVQGFAGSHQGWAFQVPAFRKRFHVITFDNRGMGKTQPSKEQYTIRTLAADVIGLMDHLGLEKAAVLGVSMGGMVAQEVAISYQRRVSKLILANTFASKNLDDYSRPRESVSESQNPKSNSSLGDTTFGQLMTSTVSSAFNGRLSRTLFLQMLKISGRPADEKNYFDQIHALSSYSTCNRLHMIQAPTLVISGRADRLVSPQHSDLIASRIPGARLVRVEGGSHAFFIETPRKFNREVLAFLCSAS